MTQLLAFPSVSDKRVEVITKMLKAGKISPDILEKVIMQQSIEQRKHSRLAKKMDALRKKPYQSCPECKKTKAEYVIPTGSGDRVFFFNGCSAHISQIKSIINDFLFKGIPLPKCIAEGTVVIRKPQRWVCNKCGEGSKELSALLPGQTSVELGGEFRVRRFRERNVLVKRFVCGKCGNPIS